MKKYQPPYTITSSILKLVSQISEVVGYLDAANIDLRSPELRKTNRIKTITDTLAIEGNTLGIDQVTDIINGKTVLGSVKEIAEVHGALKAYERLSHFSMSKESDLLAAHGLLMGDVLKEAGVYRKGAVGIHKNGEVVHVAPQASRVGDLVRSLLLWLKTTDEHPLVAGCVFHYEFEFIHPFSDGNGRMGRLWQTLILSTWKPVFEFLPLESAIRHNQAGYYKALRASDEEVSSIKFIEFMLDVIRLTCEDILKTDKSVQINVPKNVPLQRLELILSLIDKNNEITIRQLADVCDVSSKTIQRDLAKLRAQNRIQRKGSLKSGYWEIME